MTISRIAEEMQSRGVADVFKWWLFMVTDIIGELSFGESFRMLEAGEVSFQFQLISASLLTSRPENAIHHGSGGNL